MHAIVIAIGSHGDVHPMVGIALGLRRRGHRVTFVASPYFESLVRKAGLDLVPLGTADEFRRALANRDLWHPVKGFRAVFEDGVLPAMRQTYEVIAQRYVPGETVVVAHAIALGARVAQDKLGVPTVTVQLSPIVFRTVHDTPKFPGVYAPRWMPHAIKRGIFGLLDALVVDRLLGPPINTFRRELALPAVKGILRDWWLSPQLVLGLFPEWFAKRQPDWPSQLKLTTFPLYDEDDVEPLSHELEQFMRAGERPIVFTPGSAMTFGHEFFRASVEACKRLGKRGILLSRHREHIPADLPPTVRHFDYVPFSRILPRAAAVVHHGGIGTTAQALAAGCPQLIMPMAHDQLDNANRVARLGAGAWLPRRRYRARKVAAALAKLLQDQKFEQACKRVAAQFVGTRPLAQTCEQIELFALTTAPSSRRPKKEPAAPAPAAAAMPPPAPPQRDAEPLDPMESPRLRPQRPERPPEPGMS